MTGTCNNGLPNSSVREKSPSVQSLRPLFIMKKHGLGNRLLFYLHTCIMDFQIQAPGLVEIGDTNGMEPCRQGDSSPLLLIAMQPVVVDDQRVPDVQAAAVIGVREKRVDAAFR